MDLLPAGDDVRASRIAAAVGATLLSAVAALLLVQLDRRAAAASAGPSVHDPTDEARAEAVSAIATMSTTIFCDRMLKPANLVSGWSEPEPGNGIWSVGHVAVLSLPAPPKGKPADVALTVAPFVDAGLKVQRVRVRLGDVVLADLQVTKPGIFHLAVPARPGPPGGDLRLEFDLPDAASPAERAGSRDTRVLGLRLQRVQVTV